MGRQSRQDWRPQAQALRAKTGATADRAPTTPSVGVTAPLKCTESRSPGRQSAPAEPFALWKPPPEGWPLPPAFASARPALTACRRRKGFRHAQDGHLDPRRFARYRSRAITAPDHRHSARSDQHARKTVSFRAFTTGQPMPFAASVIRRPNPFVEMMMGVGVGTVAISSSKLGPGAGAVSDPHPTGYLAQLLPQSRKLYSSMVIVTRVPSVACGRFRSCMDKWVKLTPKDGSST
jgi:hypothetical protein